MHIGTHFDSFYLPEYVAMQKRFFDRFLKGIDNGWDQEPPLRIEVRDVHGKATRAQGECEWPLAQHAVDQVPSRCREQGLGPQAPAAEQRVSYDAMGDGVNFSTAPFEQDFEITGYVAARLTIASSTTDMDIFAVLRAFDPAGKEVVFIGAHEPTPVSRGWLRASHRKQDPARSKPYRPFLAHDEIQKLTPGELYTVDVEIWPTSLAAPEGLPAGADADGQGLRVRGHPGPPPA